MGVSMPVTNPSEAWATDFEEFMAYWVKAVDVLKEKHLGSEECTEITLLFHRDRDLLLCTRPSNISDDDLVSKLQPLEQKLDASLAIALTSMRK